jgi:A-macroglobulin TED domain/Alpha-2-macroglobulin family
MNACEPFQAQFLAYLYDVLEVDDVRRLREHLNQCPACQAGLARAEKQQRLLARAAKAEFASVRFEPPAETPAAVQAPALWLAQGRRRPLPVWAIAASILLLIGLGTPTLWWYLRESGAEHALAAATTRYEAVREEEKSLAAERREAVARAQKDVQDLSDQLQKLAVSQQEKWVALSRQINDRQFDVVLTGPEHLQPGARNNYEIQTVNLNRQPVPARLTAQVVDQKNHVLFEQKDVPVVGSYRLSLPPDLPVKPGTDLSLNLLAWRDGGAKSELREKLSLAAPVYLTHLTTDKPMYRPGETVHFRSLTLDRFSLKPVSETLRLLYRVTNPAGQEVFRREGAAELLREGDRSPLAGPDGKPLHGVGAGDYPIDPNSPGGEYTLSVSEASNRFPPQERKFIVNRYENPRLNKELDFTRKSYGPGDEVSAACKVSRTEGGAPVARRPVQATIQIDGQYYGANGQSNGQPLNLQTDEAGHVNVRFKLPAAMERGLGTLSVRFDDGGSVETLVRPIPIVLKKLQVEFFPEGGDLVNGLPNRVYFQVRTMLGKPAELKGRIVDQAGQVAAAEVHTLNDDKEPGVNQGMGVFAFTPEAGKHYELKIDTPSGIEGKYPLPDAKDNGVVLTIAQGVTTADEPIRVQVGNAKDSGPRTLLVGAYCRGRLMDHRTVTVEKGENTAIELNPGPDAGGVYRITVFEEKAVAGQERQIENLPQGRHAQLIPVAERLVYRTPSKQLVVNLKPNFKQYAPGEKATVNLTTLDDKEKPAPAVVMVAVVDKSVVTMADEKTARTMPTHYYLTTEVRRSEDLEYADFLLSSHPKAAAALDLLLGTQGWRRFAEQDPGLFPQKFQDENDRRDAQRLVATIGQASPAQVDLAQREVLRLQNELTGEKIRLQTEYARASEALAGVQNGAGFQNKRQEWQKRLAEADRERALAADRLETHRHLIDRAMGVVLPVVAVGLLGLAAIMLLVAIQRGSLPRAMPLYATAVASVLVAGAIALLVSWPRSDHLQLAYSPRSSGVLQSVGPQLEDGQKLGDDFGAAPEEGKKGDARNDQGRKMLLGRMAPGARMRGAGMRPVPQAPEPPGMAAGMGGRRQRDDRLVGVEQLRIGAQNFDKQAQLKDGEPPNPNMAANKNQQPAMMFRAPLADEAKASAPGAADGKQPEGRLGVFARGLEKAAVAEQLQLKKKANEVDRLDAFGATGQAVRAKAAKRMQEGEVAERQLQRMAGLRVAGPMAAPMPPAFGGMGLNGGAGGFGGGMGMMQGGGAALVNGQAGMMQGAAVPPNNIAGYGFGLRQYMYYVPQAGEMDRQVLAGIVPDVALPPAPLVVREYAHQHPTQLPGQPRSDFVDTVYWHPALVLPDGKGNFSFDLCDSITSYQVTAFAHTLDGRLGAASTMLEARLPFAIEPKLPIEVTATDTIDIPISIANNTGEQKPVAVQVAGTGLQAEGKSEAQLIVPADSRTRRLFRFRPTVVEGTASVRIDGKSEPFSDGVTRAFTVVPNGFPASGSHSDLLEKIAQAQVILPEAWIPGTLKCQVQVYPSTLADLQKGLEAMLREPGGCFEQTSSSNYPNVLILKYLKESDQANPELEQRARQLLASGYQKLVAFECEVPSEQKRRGYEWFGGSAPAHEALTAYGLLEFRDMAAVFDVDPRMVERTREYLLSQRDGKGGFKRNPRALDSFGRAPEDITNAYIIWSLTESSKDDDVSRELAALGEQAKTSNDPYFLALVANSLINRNQAEAGVALLKRVATAQAKDGHLNATRTSITGSGGRDLEIETTALAVLGWLKANRPADFNVPVQSAIKWIGQQRGGYGGFGSTQSTILALKALIAFTRANRKTAEPGDIRLFVGDRLVGQQHFEANTADAVTLAVPEPEKGLKVGNNPVRIEITGKNAFPYTLSWSYQTLKPANGEQCPVRLSTKLDRAAAAEGETVHLSVQVENTQDKGQGMAVAIIGLPAGLTLPEDMKQLKDYARLRNDGKEKGLIGHWEVRGRELVLYWRDLAPRQKIEVPLDLVCRVPGQYSGPASRAYLYYNADQKYWADPLELTIRGKD